MSEQLHTGDLPLPYQDVPRADKRFVMQPYSYLDIMLPHNANHHARLRLHDVNDRWVRAIDLSAYPHLVPDDERLLDAPYGAFDAFELGEEVIVGREHNPDQLPILNRNVISREHFSFTVTLGRRGIILAIRDLDSHNGTEVIPNHTVTPYEAHEHLTVAG